MNPKFHFIIGSVSVLAVAGSMLLPMAASGQAAQVEDVQILTRGPVHEAFAESVSFDPVAGVIISGLVPEAIEELPPEQQLEGDNVTWIPGYWAWDDEQNDFIWISGIWRNLPPGRQWVPGYWNEIDGGQSQWTSGYWADATVTEVSYVPTAPPRSIDSGPNIEAPSSNHSWVPGNWFWVDTRYAWRPGYWVPQRTDWTWVPSRYCWTRRGYVYVDGYWDYAVARRGVLFAPVYFNRHAYRRPDYYYTPSIVVGLSVFSNHLFVRPSCGHYYFGDYYAPRYRDSGYYASFSWHSGRRGYDPIHAYDRWNHRDDHGWERRRIDDYNYFRDNENARPPRTWAAMRNYREDRFNDGRNRSYATSLATYTQDTRSGQRFRALDDGRRKQIVSQRQEMRKFGQERRQLESRGSATGDRASAGSSRAKITRSPIAGREAEKFARNEAPPKRPEARADKSKMVAPAKNKAKDGVARKDSPANPRSAERGVTPRDDEARAGGKGAAPGQNRDPKTGNAGKAARPERAAENGKSKDKAPEREAKPKAEIRPTPGAKSQNAPKREVQPKPQGREMRPNKVEPRATPERKPQVAPKRESQPTPQVRKAAQPKAQTRPAPKPERKPQATPKREVPRQQVRPAPQSKGQPKQQANPQRRNPTENKKGTNSPEEASDQKNRKSKE